MEDKIKRYLLNLLSRKGYTFAELDEKLKKKGVNHEKIEKYFSWIREKGFLNEDQEMQFYIDYLYRKGYGKLLLVEKLKQRLKCSKEEIEHRFAGSIDALDFEALLKSHFEKKKARIESYKDLQRFYRWALSRGFTPDLVQNIVKGEEFNWQESSSPL